jgi:hypothetical protein
LLIGMGILRLDNAEEVPWWGWPVMVLMGLVFIGVGGGVAFGRKWTVIDAGRGAIMRRWGLLVPMQTEELSLHDYQGVALRFAAGDSDTVDRYPVVLTACGGRDLTLYSPPEYAAARERAVHVAGMLRLPLEDATTDHAAVLPPERVEETLQQRLHADEGEPAGVPRPATLRSQVDESDGTLRIVLPGPKFHPARLLELLIPLAILACVGPGLLAFFRQTETPEAVQAAFVGCGTLFFVLIPLVDVTRAAAQSRSSHSRVTVTARSVLFDERRGRHGQATRIPIGEIVDLDYSTAETAMASARSRARRALGAADTGSVGAATGPAWLERLNRLARGKGVTVKSTRGLFSFGAGLPDEEIRYLHSLVRRTLQGGP